jgi:cellulose synthase/poly-beta-1,6-N-acetylglucosamine synthase-like glycosyltransferase
LTQTLVEALFVLSVILIWFMLVYQFVLFFLGFLYSHRAQREKDKTALGDSELPAVSILIPAHNEEVVLDNTLRAISSLTYPEDRFEILVINDASTDRTGEIAERWVSRCSNLRVIHISAGERAGGKAAALNRGIKYCRFENIAVYDADNTPEPAALRHLAAQLVAHPELGAVIGTFRTVNRKRNLLTRMINIEGLSFQWIVQAGRWMLMRVCSLPGTNLIIRRALLESLGGWDENALTEDADLSIQIYQAGYQIKYVPYAITWEQEPEKLSTWFRQRIRWVRGNNYVLTKHAGQLLRIRPRRLGVELLYTMSLYYVFFAAIVISDVLFVLGLLGVFHIALPGPYTEVWLLAYMLFIGELMLALSREKGEDSLINVILATLSYFTYCQLWIPVVIKGFYDDFIRKKARTWVKTERFQPDSKLEVPE